MNEENDDQQAPRLGHNRGGDDDEDDDSDDEDDPLAHLPICVLQRVEKLKDLAAKRDTVMDEYSIERAALEKKFASVLKPLYDERKAIVVGEKDQEIAASAAAAAEGGGGGGTTNGGGGGPEGDDAAVVAGIPQFWATAMANMDIIGDWISEDDVACLEQITDIVCRDRDDGKGFTLYFYFADNEYFTNRVLTKTYEVPNLLLAAEDEPILKTVRGDTIHWKDGRSLTHRTVTKKQRGKGKNAGRVRNVTKQEEQESFFHWFSPPKLPQQLPTEEMDEEEVERIEDEFEEDFELAQAFRCQLIPSAVLWFTGEAEEVEPGAMSTSSSISEIS